MVWAASLASAVAKGPLAQMSRPGTWPSTLSASPVRNWPRLMRAQTAAAYTDEKSVKSFLRRSGSIYPSPIYIPGRGRVCTKDSLDEAIDRLRKNRRSEPMDLADDL